MIAIRSGFMCGRGLEAGVLVAALAWFVVLVALPGRFPQHIDDVFYKEAGYNLAVHGRFNAPALIEYTGLRPDYDQTFATYPPLYPFLYAQWLRVFPHTLRGVLAFDLGIRLLLALALMRVLPRLVPGVIRPLAALVAASVAVLGTAGRPDELGMLLGWSGLGLWLGGAGSRAWLAGGALLGLCAATSLPVCLVLLIVGGVIWLGRCREHDGTRTAIRSALVAGAACVAVAAAILAPYYLRPGAWEQARSVSDEFLSGIARSVHDGSPEPFLGLLRSAARSNVFRLPLNLALVAGTAALVWRGGSPRVRWLAGGLLAASLFVFVCMPQQVYYYWFLTPAMLAAVLAGKRLRSAWGVAVGVLLLVAANPALREALKAWQLPPEQTLEHAMREATARVPADSVVLTDFRSYYLLRAHCPKLIVTDGTWQRPMELRAPEFAVFGRYLTERRDGFTLPVYWYGDGRAREFAAAFEEVYNGLPTTLPRLGPLPLGRDPAGFGVAIYGRR
jgi:hypothetical protein